MEISSAKLLGRVMVLEVLLPVILTRTAELCSDPVAFIHGVMANAQTMIERIAAEAGPDEQEAAQQALQSFDDLGEAIAENLAQRSRQPGSG